MRLLLCMTCGIVLFASAAIAESCQVARSIPTELKALGGGTATASRDETTTFRGGQTAYVKIKNLNVLGVSMTLRIAVAGQPELCTYKAILLPRSTAIYYGALFAQPPVVWTVTVGAGDESDSAILSYQVYSQNVSKSDHNRKHSGK